MLEVQGLDAGEAEEELRRELAALRGRDDVRLREAQAAGPFRGQSVGRRVAEHGPRQREGRGGQVGERAALRVSANLENVDGAPRVGEAPPLHAQGPPVVGVGRADGARKTYPPAR